MPTKTDRILGYLPRTFRPDPQKSALRAVVDAFGKELLDGENSLAAVMQSHWVDHADLFAEQISDLARIASLYGLAPRPDEDVEEFREHLKRYVRTFLEGTVTVQGILRVSAETLGLRIADDYADMDTWWTRTNDQLTLDVSRADDAAVRLFGGESVSVRGLAASPARVVGGVNLSGGVDLRAAPRLSLQVDEIGPLTINLIDGIEDRADNVSLDDIVAAINDAFGAAIASHDQRFLTLTSPTSGEDSLIYVDDISGDAAEAVLNLKPFEYQGRDAFAASVTSTLDHSGGVNLSDVHYLRLIVDGVEAEIDVAGGDPANTTLSEIRDAINDVFPGVADHDGQFLTLTSPTVGAGSSLSFRAPASQDAAARIFGAAPTNSFGEDDQPARFSGAQLSPRLDLSERAVIRLGVDGQPVQDINCAGNDPAATRPEEVVDAINAALGATVAQLSGRALLLRSPGSGAGGVLQIGTPEEGDATDIILGLQPRTFRGTDATGAHFLSPVDLSSGLNLMAQHQLLIAVDGGAPVEVDLRARADDVTDATIRNLADAINDALGVEVAAQAGDHLSLTSASVGSASQIEVLPLMDAQSRRFVSRAMITDEAARAILGFVAASVRGSTGTQAALVGTRDLSRGVDLRENRYLHLTVDGRDPVEIDAAGERPRAALIDKVAEKINAAAGEKIAFHDGRFISLRSTIEGEESRIALEPPQTQDVLSVLGLQPGSAFGAAATGVRFVGLVDLSAGIDLSAGDRVSIGIDANPPAEIALAAASADPAHVSLIEMVSAINTAIGPNVARQENGRIVLTSKLTGAASRIEFAAPSSGDATEAVFGIAAPRLYLGLDAAPAVMVGSADLSAPSDLSVQRFLRLGIGVSAPVVIDCAAQAGDPSNVLGGDIALAVNTALGVDAASIVDGRLMLTTPTVGVSARLSVETYTGGNAAFSLFGVETADVRGIPSAAAEITGDIDISRLVDLSERRWLRLSLDGARPVTIEIKGGAQEAITPEEIVDAIEQVLPGVASLTEDDRLRLTSPTKGRSSRVDVLPLRYIEVVEYPPDWIQTQAQAVRHGDAVTISNDGAGDTSLDVWIYAPRGVNGPTLVNSQLNWRIQFCGMVLPGESLHLYQTDDGLRADRHKAGGAVVPVPPDQIFVGPMGGQTHVPFEGVWRLRGGSYDVPTLQLNNPLASNIVLLRARQPGAVIRVRVVESAALSAATDVQVGDHVRLVGRLVWYEDDGWRLLDADDEVLAAVRAHADISALNGRVVVARGTLHEGEPPVLLVDAIAAAFDVSVREEGAEYPELYPAVTIGGDPASDDALTDQLQRRSALVRSELWEKTLPLPQGRSVWRYLDCLDSRYDRDDYGEARFAGGVCYEPGVFNVSRFAAAPEHVMAVYGSAAADPDPHVEISFTWQRHQPGVFEVNLPLDLPERFGGRYNQMRFGGAQPELFPQMVTEPETDPNFVVKLVNGEAEDRGIRRSHLVRAEMVTFLPVGFTAVEMPFRDPVYLQHGTDDKVAALYLFEADVPGRWLRLYADDEGTWGNNISIVTRPAGPAMYDLLVSYTGQRFENARKVVLGKNIEDTDLDLPAEVSKLLIPGPIGILQAKAAGVRASVTRDRA